MCDRADWLLWMVAHTLPRQRLVWVACQIARTALPPGEIRPLRAIEAAEKWTLGEATIAEVRTAADAAYAAAVADAAHAAAYAAAYAAAAAAAAAAVSDAVTRSEILGIIKREIAWEEIEAALPPG